MAELVPYAKRHFGRFTPRKPPDRHKPTGHVPGTAVPVVVLASEAFEREHDLRVNDLIEEERDLLTKYRPKYVGNTLGDVGRAPGAKPVPVSLSTILTRAQREIVWQRLGRSTGKPAAFYSKRRQAIVVRIDQVLVDVIAHELMHAYASESWNEFQIAFAIQSEVSLPDAMRAIDEGVTSELADLVLHDWFAAALPRPASKPSGYVGYIGPVRTAGIRFIVTVDGGGGTPGPNTMRAYFRGDIVFRPNEDDPLNSFVRVSGAKAMKLKDLL